MAGFLVRRKPIATDAERRTIEVVRIVFTRQPQGECLARIYRNDGVVVLLPSYSRKWRVPHDLAHAVAERELGLSRGVFGSIASGGVFKNMRIVEGRPRHDAAARSARILRANSRDITVAEVMAGAVHDAVEYGSATDPVARAREGWGVVEARPFPWIDADFAHAVDTLSSLARRWEVMGADGALELTWPDRLIEPVPPERRHRRPALHRR